MTQKLNLGSIVAAIILFFLPWLDIQCKGTTLVTQSGIQTITGGASTSKEFDSMGGNKERANSSKDGEGKAVLALLALVLVGLALLITIMSLNTPAGQEGRAAGLCCAAALVLLIIQLSTGFPVEQSLHKELKKNEMGTAVAMAFQIKRTPWLYLELAALAIPALLALNSMVSGPRRGPQSGPSY